MRKREQEKLAELLVQAESDKVSELKDTNKRLLKQLDKLKDKKADLVEAVYKGAKDGMSTVTLPKVKAPKKSTTHGQEICVPLLSDIQLAKNTDTLLRSVMY